MTASAPPIAAPANPAVARGAVAAQGAPSPGQAAGGALTGFEALIAALFPAVTPATAATGTAAKDTAGKDAKAGSAAKAADDAATGDSADAANDAQSAIDASQALAASLVAPLPAATQDAGQSAPAGDDKSGALADVLGKAQGKPFTIPRVALADAQTSGEEATAEAATETPAAATKANVPTPAAKSASAAAPPAWGLDKPAGQPAAPALENAANRQEPAPFKTEQPAPAAAAATDTSAEPELAALAAPPAPAEAQAAKAADRPTKAERAKAAADGGAVDPLKPTEAVDRPVHAKAADGAGKPASADAPSIDDDAKPLAAGKSEPETRRSGDDALAPDTRAASQSSAPTAHAAQVVRGSPETVATLAAQIIKKLEGRSTRFDLELNPAGLGKVDVRLDIGAHGRISATLTCDNPGAAAELKARANDLQRALENAGFDLSGGLTFDVADDGSRRQGQAWRDQAETNSHGPRGQAFQAALATANDADPGGALQLRRGLAAGLDMRI